MQFSVVCQRDEKEWKYVRTEWAIDEIDCLLTCLHAYMSFENKHTYIHIYIHTWEKRKTKNATDRYRGTIYPFSILKFPQLN